MRLADNQFIGVINATPLVAIDLIVLNEKNEVLLGRRRHRPAQDYWFVPGGRIRKNERSQDALQRIAQSELQMPVSNGRLIGVFDHFYADNFYGVADVSTHYVTLAYQVEVNSGSTLIHDEQHVEIKWWDLASLRASQAVHDNAKLYFSTTTDNGFRCKCE